MEKRVIRKKIYDIRTLVNHHKNRLALGLMTTTLLTLLASINVYASSMQQSEGEQLKKSTTSIFFPIINNTDNIVREVTDNTFDLSATLFIPAVVSPKPTDFSEEVEIPGGVFKMGCESDNDKCPTYLRGDEPLNWWDSDEWPVHLVYLDGYHIDKYEVTNARYKECVEEGKCTVPKDYDDRHIGHPIPLDKLPYSDPDKVNHPVVYMTWQQARDFCLWSGRRLPTEAEWEIAATYAKWEVGETEPYRAFPWGSFSPVGRANYAGAEVNDTLPADDLYQGDSKNGVRNMAGNVAEWTGDWYGDEYYRETNPTDPQAPIDNPHGPPGPLIDFFGEPRGRVIRGGSFINDGYGDSGERDSIRAHDRSAPWTNLSYPSDLYTGFRCARDDATQTSVSNEQMRVEAKQAKANFRPNLPNRR